MYARAVLYETHIAIDVHATHYAATQKATPVHMGCGQGPTQ